MDQPRPRAPASELIIESPQHQPRLHRAAFGLVTLAFWALWLYFMMPAVTLLGWAFGISRFVDVMIVNGGALAVVRLLGWYLLIIAILSGSLIGWAVYNWTRFRNSTRRSNASRPVADAVVAARLGVDRHVLARWQRARSMQVNFDDEGRFAGVSLDPALVDLKASEPPQPSPATESV
jgi:biofilm PGA synthesis protein PgaD